MKRRYIIFADDDADDLELLTGFFKQYNRSVHVLEFRDGKEVLMFLDDFAISANQPLAIVLDINMPRVNGREALVTIRKNQRLKHIPVVIYTTSSSQSDKEFCEKYEASWVNKPYNIEEVRSIARILADFCNQQS